MPALADRYTVIAPDMRGYGDSDKPERGYDAQTLAEDFHQLVAYLGFRQIHLVAHDMGAPAALLYAAQYPDEVLSLTYLEEPVLLTNNERYHLHLSSIHQIAALKLRSKYCFACGMALHERCGSCNELLVSLKFRCCPYCGTTYKSSK